MRWLAVIVLLPMLLLFAPSAANAVDECEGYISTGNPFSCCTWGNCTWWAWSRRPDLGPHWSGDAKAWYQEAKTDELDVGNKPIVGSIGCFNSLSARGHVNFVETVNSDGSFTASEMNCNVASAKHMRIQFYSAGSATGFIYGKTAHLSKSGARSKMVACRNQNSWLGSMTSDIHEWHPSGGTGKWVYIIDYQKGSVVCDVPGGSEEAYAIDSYLLGQWAIDHGCAGSNIGSLISSRYSWNSGYRIDGQFGFLFEKSGYNPGPYGWSDHYGPGVLQGLGWNPMYSYKLSACYTRNGGRNNVGMPASGSGVLAYAHPISYTPLVAQDYLHGEWNDVVILYDVQARLYASIVAGYCPSPNKSDQACCLHGGLRGYWESQGRFDSIGAPFTDEVPVSGKSYLVYQRFIRRSGSNWVGCELRYYPNGSVSKMSLFTKAVLQSADAPIVELDDGQESPPPESMLLLTPNPTAGSSSIRFTLPSEERVQLVVYDIIGRLVATLVDETRPAGAQQASWDGKDGQGHAVADGIYFVRLTTPGAFSTQRLVIVH